MKIVKSVTNKINQIEVIYCKWCIRGLQSSFVVSINLFSVETNALLASLRRLILIIEENQRYKIFLKIYRNGLKFLMCDLFLLNSP